VLVLVLGLNKERVISLNSIIAHTK